MTRPIERLADYSAGYDRASKATHAARNEGYARGFEDGRKLERERAHEDLLFDLRLVALGMAVDGKKAEAVALLAYADLVKKRKEQGK